MIYDDYIQYCDEYRARYGDKTVVLMQVGDFFELYGVQTDDETLGADMYTIGDICNIVITRKNKAVLQNSRQNPLMAGFPLYAVQKHAQSLLDNGYTVVIIRQTTPPPNVTREVTEIMSPAMNMTPTSAEGSFLLTYYWEPHAVGMAGVDVTTGETFYYEVATHNDEHFVFDEAFRILQTYQPKEVLLVGNPKHDHISYIENLLQTTTATHRVYHVKWGTTYKPEVHKLAYQTEVVNKVYTSQLNTCAVEPFEMLGLDRLESARHAFVHMLVFAFDHNEQIMQKLHIPTRIEQTTTLNLEYNSAVQLNILGSFPGDQPLLKILNRCCTSMGRRLFRQRLLFPSAIPEVIESRYCKIQRLIDTEGCITHMRKLLKNIGDIERQFRRIELGSLPPLEMYAFHMSMETIVHVATCDDVHNSVVSAIQDVIQSYVHTLNIEECAKYTLSDIKTNIFHVGVHPDIDLTMQDMTAALTCIQDIAKDITSNGDGDTCLCRVESNERDGYFLQMTKKRWDTVKQRTSVIYKNLDIASFSAKPISSGSSVLRITHPVIEQASERILQAQKKVATNIPIKYKEFLSHITTACSSQISRVIEYISDIDVATTNAYNACEYGYTRPNVEHTSSSYVQIRGLRHPIIERLNTKVGYVTNDVCLDGSGMLLYGINASGKSSLMKAIGLNIVMAQSGMFVPAEMIRFSPYHHLFTRITGMDNIYRGMSTFVVEMAELRNIIRRANAHSLVIGDEVCAGTESVSAVAIVAAALNTLLQSSASFMFATHLHELPQLSILKDREALHVYHMHIETDLASGKIIYDRKLRPGSGSSVYGLEVCESLGMPREFLQVAHTVRRECMDIPTDVVPNKWSRYNKSVCVDMCSVCKTERACDVHHIAYQHTATSNNFVKNGVHVHDRSNLVPICKSCHVKEHTGQLKIHGYRQTSSGIELVIDEQQTPCTSTTSFDDVVKRMKQKYRYTDGTFYMKTMNGRWRKTQLQKIQQTQGYTFTQEELEDVKAALSSSS